MLRIGLWIPVGVPQNTADSGRKPRNLLEPLPHHKNKDFFILLFEVIGGI